MKVLVFFFLIFVALFTSSFRVIDKPAPSSDCIQVCGPNLDFTLVNMTGYDISDIYVGPSTQYEWGDDIMGPDVVENGSAVDVSFSPNETDELWDIYVTWVGYAAEEDVFWIGLDLSVISEITLYYDETTGRTWAETR